MVPSNYINYHRLTHNYTKRPSRLRLPRTGCGAGCAGGYVWPFSPVSNKPCVTNRGGGAGASSKVGVNLYFFVFSVTCSSPPRFSKPEGKLVQTITGTGRGSIFATAQSRLVSLQMYKRGEDPPIHRPPHPRFSRPPTHPKVSKRCPRG